MARKGVWLALGGALAGAAAGSVAQRVALDKRRRTDPEGDEEFGSLRGERSHHLQLSDGAQVFIEEVGPAGDRGALFIHGSALRTDMWHYQLKGLGGHRLVFCDLRGHGLSQAKGTSQVSMAQLGDDLEEVIKLTGLKEVVIVGHSVGGMIALDLCRRRPELMGSTIKGLGLVNTTYGPVTETLIGGGVGLARIERVARRPIDALGNYHKRIERLRKLIKPSDAVFWAVAVMGFGPKASAKQIDFTYQMISETPAEVIFDLLRTYRDYDMTDKLEDVTVPALVIGGDHDRITMPKASEYLAAHLPKAELKIFEDCGHMAMLERHEEVNVMLERFFTDTLGAPKRRKAAR